MVRLTETESYGVDPDAKGAAYVRVPAMDPQRMALEREAHYRVVHESREARAEWLAQYEAWYAARARAGLRFVPFLAQKLEPNPLAGWSWSGWAGRGPSSCRIA